MRGSLSGSTVKKALRALIWVLLGSVFVLCIILQVLPNSTEASIFPKWLFKYRQAIMAEINAHAGEPYAPLEWIAVIVKYSVFLVFMFWKEAATCIVMYRFFPQAKAVLYNYTPDWVDDWGSRVVATFSNDEMEPPPELEGDELTDAIDVNRSIQGYGRSLGCNRRYRNGKGGQPMTPSLGCVDCCCGATGGGHAMNCSNSNCCGGSCCGGGSIGGDFCDDGASSSNTQHHCMSPSKFVQYNGQEVDADDWYVFDPVYGVIPITCRDLWAKQGREMDVRREAAIDRSRGKSLPPVRFSGGS